jgi:hypothetical protein
MGSGYLAPAFEVERRQSHRIRPMRMAGRHERTRRQACCPAARPRYPANSSLRRSACDATEGSGGRGSRKDWRVAPAVHQASLQGRLALSVLKPPQCRMGPRLWNLKRNSSPCNRGGAGVKAGCVASCHRRIRGGARLRSLRPTPAARRLRGLRTCSEKASSTPACRR